MTDGYLSNNDVSAAVRVPSLAVSFGSNGGGLSGAVGIGGAGNPWQRSVILVSVETGLAPFVDVAKIDLAADGEAPAVAIEDGGSISMGYNDSSAALVFTAAVNRVNTSIIGTRRLEAVNGGLLLSRLRPNQSYEQQNAADIVNDLAGQAGVETDLVENGIDFPYYVIDDRQNAYQHIDALARKCGFVAFVTPEGKLFFGAPPGGQPVQTFNYALDIIHLTIKESAPVFQSATLIGAGAAGSQGQEAWPWLVKDPESITGQSGDGNGDRIVGDAALRSAAALQTAADGIVAAAALGALSGRMVVPGAPAVVVGSTIEIADAPNAALNGNFLVMRVRHEFSKQRGFISCIDFSRPANGGALGGLGGVL
jgi:hypothetical protein